MSDAMGGTVTLVIIAFFIVAVLGYLAFNVNYTKAFRMKNKIISVYDDYNGECNSKCEKEIKAYANSIGYKPGKLDCSYLSNLISKSSVNAVSVQTTSKNNLYCRAEIQIKKRASNDSINDFQSRSYYKIATTISIDIPIIKSLFDFGLFWVSGNTKTYKR